MRLIDADANIETMKKCAENPENAQALLCYRYAQRILGEAPTVEPASPWHRVEEPPKEEGRYWFAVWFDGHWIFDAAWYTHDISTVIDVLCCERVGGFYKGNTEVHPDYWMPIEPPKEEEE